MVLQDIMAADVNVRQYMDCVATPHALRKNTKRQRGIDGEKCGCRERKLFPLFICSFCLSLFILHFWLLAFSMSNSNFPFCSLTREVWPPLHSIKKDSNSCSLPNREKSLKSQIFGFCEPHEALAKICTCKDFPSVCHLPVM